VSKRWTKEEDDFVHCYHEVGDFIGSHDLGRRDSSIGPRIRKLKAAGVWDAMSVEKLAEAVWTFAFNRSQVMWDEGDIRRVEWMQRNATAVLALMEAGIDLQSPSQTEPTALTGSAGEEIPVTVLAAAE